MQLSIYSQNLPLDKKWNFPLRISSVNMPKSAVNFIFCAVYMWHYQVIWKKANQSINSFFKNTAWSSTSLLVILSELWKISLQNIFLVNGWPKNEFQGADNIGVSLKSNIALRKEMVILYRRQPRPICS